MEALILVDLQNDFLPGRALPVSDGDAVVPVADKLIPRFDVIAATRTGILSPTAASPSIIRENPPVR